MSGRPPRSEATTTDRPPSDRVLAFDLLRAFAIIGVVLVHARGPHMILAPWLSWLVSQGARGVQLFFVISALTLMTAARGPPRCAARMSLAGFFARRFLRVAPMFYIGALLSLTLDGMGPRDEAPHGIGIADIVLTLLFGHGWNPVSFNSVVPGGWSIACEASFYLLFPVIAVLATSLGRALVLFAAALVACRAADLLLLPTLVAPYAKLPTLAADFSTLWFPAELPVFMAGIVAFFVLAGGTGTDRPVTGPVDRRRQVARRLPALLVAALASLILHAGFARYGVLFALLAVAVCLWCDGRRSLVLARILAGLAWIGRISFSIYIVHFPIMRAIHALIPAGGALTLLATVTLALSASIALSAATWTCVEHPAIRLGRRLSGRLDDRAAP